MSKQETYDSPDGKTYIVFSQADMPVEKFDAAMDRFGKSKEQTPGFLVMEQGLQADIRKNVWNPLKENIINPLTNAMSQAGATIDTIPSMIMGETPEKNLERNKNIVESIIPQTPGQVGTMVGMTSAAIGTAGMSLPWQIMLNAAASGGGNALARYVTGEAFDPLDTAVSTGLGAMIPVQNRLISKILFDSVDNVTKKEVMEFLAKQAKDTSNTFNFIALTPEGMQRFAQIGGMEVVENYNKNMARVLQDVEKLLKKNGNTPNVIQDMTEEVSQLIFGKKSAPGMQQTDIHQALYVLRRKLTDPNSVSQAELQVTLDRYNNRLLNIYQKLSQQPGGGEIADKFITAEQKALLNEYIVRALERGGVGSKFDITKLRDVLNSERFKVAEVAQTIDDLGLSYGSLDRKIKEFFKIILKADPSDQAYANYPVLDAVSATFGIPRPLRKGGIAALKSVVESNKGKTPSQSIEPYKTLPIDWSAYKQFTGDKE